MKKYSPILFISPLIILIDQLTKKWVLQNIAHHQSIPVIRDYFDLVYVKNPGAAFGMLANWDSTHRHLFFVTISLFAMVALCLLYYKTAAGEKRIQIPLALILGGAIGNLADRFLHGFVVDFLSLHWQNKIADFHLLGQHVSFALYWPAFNVADMAISCGAIFLLIVVFFFDLHSSKNTADSTR